MLIIGQERIAEVFGVAPKTIVEWQEQGLQIAKRGAGLWISPVGGLQRTTERAIFPTSRLRSRLAIGR